MERWPSELQPLAKELLKVDDFQDKESAVFKGVAAGELTILQWKALQPCVYG